MRTTGIRGDRGSGGERVRALGRLRGAQLPGARRCRAARRRREVPLGGGRQGQRGVRSRAQLPRPRRGRPDRARLHARRRLWGWAPHYSESRKGVSATTASTPAFAWTRASRRPAADARIGRGRGLLSRPAQQAGDTFGRSPMRASAASVQDTRSSRLRQRRAYLRIRQSS